MSIVSTYEFRRKAHHLVILSIRTTWSRAIRFPEVCHLNLHPTINWQVMLDEGQPEVFSELLDFASTTGSFEHCWTCTGPVALSNQNVPWAEFMACWCVAWRARDSSSWENLAWHAKIGSPGKHVLSLLCWHDYIDRFEWFHTLRAKVIASLKHIILQRSSCCSQVCTFT